MSGDARGSSLGHWGCAGEHCTRFSIAGFWAHLVQGSRPCSRASPAVLHLPCSHRMLTNVPFLWQEEFRLERGPQLLALVEDAFSRQADGLQDRWLISLSKPSENDKHLLMTLAGEQGKCWEKEPSCDGGVYLRGSQKAVLSYVGRSFCSPVHFNTTSSQCSLDLRDGGGLRT